MDGVSTPNMLIVFTSNVSSAGGIFRIASSYGGNRRIASTYGLERKCMNAVLPRLAVRVMPVIATWPINGTSESGPK